MRSDPAAPVAVVGGGFSGVMTAVQLARRGVPVVLIEAREQAGRGVAYGTTEPRHLLNVPAGRMSAFPDDPDHFRGWLGAEEGTFARRRDFGTYLTQLLADHPGVAHAQGRVSAMVRDGEGWLLKLDDGRELTASAAVLALGNEAPAVPAGWQDLPLVADPWSAAAREALAGLAGREGEVLLVGTGLTTVDVLLSLEASGFAGRTIAVSRRGLAPRAHAPHDPVPVSLGELPQGSVRALTRWLRRQSEAVGFRAAVDSLRPHSIALWQGLPLEEQRRFLRHARPWWDVHRHRIAPELGSWLEARQESGRLEIIAARLGRIADGKVSLRLRNGGERIVEPLLVINCTGPLGAVRRTSNPLLRQLLEDEQVAPDPLSIGLRTDRDDRVAPRLWAIGPLTKGMYWEMIAVPDIRGQAARIAETIFQELASHG